MAKQLIPRITPAMLSHNPDQVSEILNRLIRITNEADWEGLQVQVNELRKKLTPAPGPEPTPTPTGAYSQVLQFDPNRMGRAQGWCLQNCREGFGINVGHMPGAYEDMLWNKEHGYLHEETYPPADISVPIYIYTGMPHQHIVVWHHGVVYSDGVVIPNWVSYFGEQNIYGWAEYCDNNQVVVKN